MAGPTVFHSRDSEGFMALSEWMDGPRHSLGGLFEGPLFQVGSLALLDSTDPVVTKARFATNNKMMELNGRGVSDWPACFVGLIGWLGFGWMV